MNFLKQNNFSGRIINMDNFAGYLTPVYTEKQSQLLFYEESYHDLRKWGFMDELTNESLILFNQPLSNNTDYIIEKNNLIILL